MTNKDYLEIAKRHLIAGRHCYDHEDRYTGPGPTQAAQAQAAAAIATAERLDKLTAAVTLLVEEWRKYNGHVELRIEDGKTFGDSGMILGKT